MSPEVYKREPYNEKGDVFSFAIVMYEVWSRVLLVLLHTTGNQAPSVQVGGT